MIQQQYTQHGVNTNTKPLTRTPTMTTDVPQAHYTPNVS